MINYKQIYYNYLSKISLTSIFIYSITLLTIIKIIATVFTSPIMGYANNYDFLRQSSCIGIWQSIQDKPKTSEHLEGPVNSLIYDGSKDQNLCMNSIDNAFPWIAKSFHKIGDKIDFREISLWKTIILLLGFSLLIHIATEKYKKLAISLIFFLVFGDITNLLYINTLYLEFSVITSSFFALFFTILLILSTSKNIPLFVLASISIVWLGLAKQQYMPLAVLLGLICTINLIKNWKEKRFYLLFLLISIAIPIIYNKMNPPDHGHMKAINFANKTDTFLGAILPASTNKEAALLTLGLPKNCLIGIGQHWYTPGIHQNFPCPEVENLSRFKLIKLFIRDPSTFKEPIRNAILGVLPFYPPYLGHLENKTDENSLKYLFLKKSSLSYILAKITKEDFYNFILISITFGLFSLILWITLKNINSSYRFLLMMVSMGSLVIFYSISSSVFGDGYIALQKHAVGLLIGVAFHLVGLILLFMNWISARLCLN